MRQRSSPHIQAGKRPRSSASSGCRMRGGRSTPPADLRPTRQWFLRETARALINNRRRYSAQVPNQGGVLAVQSEYAAPGRGGMADAHASGARGHRPCGFESCRPDQTLGQAIRTDGLLHAENAPHGAGTEGPCPRRARPPSQTKPALRRAGRPARTPTARRSMRRVAQVGEPLEVEPKEAHCSR